MADEAAQPDRRAMAEEAMRWWSLIGTAVTFVASTWVFIDYHNMLQREPDREMAKARPEYRDHAPVIEEFKRAADEGVGRKPGATGGP